jgi:hypothetical protein
MSIFEQLKESLSGSHTPDGEGVTRPALIPATGLPIPKDGVMVSIATNPGTPVGSEGGDEVDKSTWDSFVDSMEHARKRASVILTGDVIETHPPPLIESKLPTESDFAATLRSWWIEATQLMEEAKITVEEKWTEMVGAEEIRNDPLRRLREQLQVYEESLEQLKTEAYTFALCGESFTRIGSQGLETAIRECFDQRGPQSIGDQYIAYKSTHTECITPIINEVRGGIEHVTNMIAEEVAKLHALKARYSRRDRLHKNLMDQRARVGARRETDSKRRLEGGVIDSKSLEELYEMSRTMDAIDSDFRFTSEQIIMTSEEILSHRSQTFQKLFAQLIEVQNACIYQIGHTCSNPFQELLENVTDLTPLEDDLTDLGSHPLTWRGTRDPSREESFQPPAELPTTTSGVYNPPPANPNYSYARKSTLLLDEKS